MENVQDRRERLAAMREQAALEDGSDSTASKTVTGSSFSLPNPMMEELPVTTVGKNHSSGFDFYTHPLTAFTGAKRRKPADASVHGRDSPFEPGIPGTEPPPVFNNLPLRPPPPPLGHHGWQPVPYIPPIGAPGAHPSFSMGQPPNFVNQSDGRGMDMGFGGRGRGMYSPVGGKGSYANAFHGQGRGYGRTNNSWNSGRGAVYAGVNYSRDFQTSGSRGRGGQRGGKTSSARDQPHLYFKKSMVEDPWKRLEEKLNTFKG